MIHAIHGIGSPDYKFAVIGRVAAVFDTNGNGDLLPVGFAQTDDGFKLVHAPYGQIYVQFQPQPE